jgi:hypothetical protein
VLAIGDELNGRADLGSLFVEALVGFVADKLVGLEDGALKEAQDTADNRGAAFISAYGGVEGANVDALVDHDPKLGG